MIYLIFAMRVEAEPFIERYNLKKNKRFTRMDVFENDNVAAVISGTGILRAGLSVTEYLSSRAIGIEDFLVNVGICGCTYDNADAPGKIFICNKIESDGISRTFYPDMLYKNAFEESDITSCTGVIADRSLVKTGLVDMEAAGVYAAGIRFMRTSQIAVIKIASDMCDGTIPDKAQVIQMISKRCNTICDWISGIADYRKTLNSSVMTAEEISATEQLSDMLSCSETMSNILKQHLIYYKLTGIDICKMISEFIEDNALTEKVHKKEGKVLLELICNYT